MPFSLTCSIKSTQVRLFITPYAKCIHKASPKDYEDKEELKKQTKEYRKYVLMKLFGFRGILLYY